MKKMKFMSILLTVMVLCCVVVFNMVFGIVADNLQLNLDLTHDKVYEFSALTENTITKLKDPTTAYLLQYDGVDAHLEQLLDKYATVNSKFKVKKINPYEDPETMAKFSGLYQDPQNPNLIILECGERQRAISAYEIFPNSEYGSQYLDAERQITNGIRYVTGQIEESVIYFTMGHEEGDKDVLVDLMIEEGYKYGEIDLSTQKISEDTSVVIAYMPKRDFSDAETDAIKAYVKGGGNFVYITTSYGLSDGENLTNYIKDWGIEVEDVYMQEHQEDYYVSEGTYASVLDMQEHIVTNSLIEAQLPMFSPLLPNTLKVVRSKNGSKVTPLLKSSPNSYGKNSIEDMDFEYKAGDPVGPFVMAAISENASDGSGKVCVISGSLDTSFADKQFIRNSNLANYDFTLNLINYMGGVNVESGIRAKNISPDTFTLSPEETKRISSTLIIFVPVIIFAAAFIVWIRRRFK